MRENRTTYATLIPIVVGVVLASGGEPEFHLIGFLACLLATAARALKTVVQVGARERGPSMNIGWSNGTGMQRGTGCRVPSKQ